MILAALVLGGLSAAGAQAPSASLREFRWSRTADTIHLDLAFAGGRPVRQRVGPPAGKPGAAELRIDLEGVRLDSVFRGKWPRWMDVEEDRASGSLALRILLDAPTPWRSRWTGNGLRVDLVDDVRSRSLLGDPLVLGGIGAAAVAGGVVLWLGASDPKASSPPVDDAIPPPDVVLPR